MNNLIKVRLKDIWSSIYKDKKPNLKSWFYGWDKLKKSIVENGYDPENFTHMEVYKSEDDDSKYILINGNHRLKILEELYGLDYEVTVNLNDSPKSATKSRRPLVRYVPQVRVRLCHPRSLWFLPDLQSGQGCSLHGSQHRFQYDYPHW